MKRKLPKKALRGLEFVIGAYRDEKVPSFIIRCMEVIEQAKGTKSCISVSRGAITIASRLAAKLALRSMGTAIPSAEADWLDAFAQAMAKPPNSDVLALLERMGEPSQNESLQDVDVAMIAANLCTWDNPTFYCPYPGTKDQNRANALQKFCEHLKKKIADSSAERKRALPVNTTALAPQGMMPPCPGGPWWIGTEDNWRAWVNPLQEHEYLEVRTKGKPLWKASVAFAGIVARAAQLKGWLASYVGKDGSAAFMKRTFAFGDRPPSRNAFTRAHASVSDKAFADALLPEYGLDASQIKELLKNPPRRRAHLS